MEAAEERYHKLVEAFIKNKECINALQRANEAIAQEVQIVMNEIHPMLEHKLARSYESHPELEETRQIYCDECNCDYEDQIKHGKEAAYLQAESCKYCSSPGLDALIIIDLETGWHYDLWSGEFEATER